MVELIVIILVGALVLAAIGFGLYKVFKAAWTKEPREDIQVTSTASVTPGLYPNRNNLRPRPDIKPTPRPPRLRGSGNVRLVIPDETFDRIIKESPNEVEAIKELLREYTRRSK